MGSVHFEPCVTFSEITQHAHQGHRAPVVGRNNILFPPYQSSEDNKTTPTGTGAAPGDGVGAVVGMGVGVGVAPGSGVGVGMFS